MIEYKGYVGVVEYDADLDTFHGQVVNTQDVITFYGSSVEELHAEMEQSVETYLKFCEEQGRPPEKPYSGSLTVRTSPELHRKVAMAASRGRQSMNRFVQVALERAVGD
jgi:predicted HicB family RNase H-like nuclease